MIAPPSTVVILSDGPGCPELPLIASGGVARAVVWPGVGAYKRSMHRFSLSATGATVRQEHPSEAVYYVIDGTATVRDERAGTAQELVAGSMAHITPGTPYSFEAGPAGAELVGGPCPADLALYQGLS